MNYVPNFKSTLWTLILLADLRCDKNDKRIKKPLKEIKNHFFDPKHGIYALKEDHFPIPASIVKLMKGISFIPLEFRTTQM